MKKLLKQVREVVRKANLPVVRKGPNGLVVPPKFTQEELNLMVKLLERRALRQNGGKLGSNWRSLVWVFVVIDLKQFINNVYI